MVGLTIEIVLDQDRWRLDFQDLTDYSEFLRGLWLAVWEHHLETGKGLSPLVSALLFCPNDCDSCRGAPCRCYASVPLLSALRKSLKSWLPQAANNKQGKGVKATPSAKLEMRVWPWVFRRDKMHGSPQENVKALSKMWNTK